MRRAVLDKMQTKKVVTSYRATMDFSLGTGEKIYRDQTIAFDGFNLITEEGVRQMPFLKGAIKQGWLVPEGDSESGPPGPRVAPLTLGPTQHTGNSDKRTKVPIYTTEEDAKPVTSIKDRTASVEKRNKGLVATVDDGTVVRSVSTPTHMKSRLDSTGSAQAEITKYENKIQIKPEAQKHRMEDMSDEDLEAYLQEKERRIQARVATLPSTPRIVAPGKRMPVISGDEDSSIAISTTKTKKAKTKKIEAEGISFEVTAPLNQDAPDPETLWESPPPKKSSVSLSSDASRRLLMARKLCKDFPENYNFDAPDRKKLARITADYEDRPDVVRAIWTVEKDAFKVVLEENFPDLFS